MELEDVNGGDLAYDARLHGGVNGGEAVTTELASRIIEPLLPPALVVLRIFVATELGDVEGFR